MPPRLSPIAVPRQLVDPSAAQKVLRRRPICTASCAHAPDMAFSATLSGLLYRLDRTRSAVGAWIAHTANLGLFVGLVLLFGIGSSWYLVDVGTRLTTQRQGPWITWTHAAGRDVDPYTRAHISRQGSLPLSGSIGATYEARFDAEGQRLHSSCEYLIESGPLDANWWSLAVYDDYGLLIPNAADRHAFNSATLAPNPDGTFFIVLARDARPGNWLPVGGAGRLTLLLTLLQPQVAQVAVAPSAESKRLALPVIRRIGCR